jgi:hypothetical protein
VTLGQRNPARSKAAQLRALARVGSPADRPRSPSSGPKTTVGREASTRELPPPNGPREGARASVADPARSAATRSAHIVSSRITHQPSRPAVEWPEDHLPTGRSDLRAATVEPPFERRSGNRPGSILSDADTAHVRLDSDHSPTVATRLWMARRPPSSRKVRPASCYRRTAFWAALRQRTRHDLQ